jgi:hypothetical protein
MKYIPGQIHESLQKIHFLEVNHDFIWSNCNGKRYRDFKDSFDWDRHSIPIEVKSGDILSVRFFNYGLKYNQFSSAYCYLEKIISGSVEVEFFTETIISFEFIKANSKIFTNVTNIMERDRKINQIINQ